MRIKISFSEINKGKMKIISPKLLSETKERIRKEMKPIVRKNIRDLVLSEIHAKNTIMS